MNNKYIWFSTISVVSLLIGCVVLFDLQQYLSLDYLSSRHSFYKEYCTEHPTLTLLIYFILYMLLTAASLPGLSVFILVGGTLFGFSTTLLVISFSDALGSTLAFLISRKIFGAYLQERFPNRLRAVNLGIARGGAFYLIYLRLVPIFPCFLINLLMGLSNISVKTFYWGTQLGKLPHNALYVNAGTQIRELNSVPEIFSPGVIFSFALIAIFPFIAKKAMRLINDRKLRYLPIGE